MIAKQSSQSTNISPLITCNVVQSNREWTSSLKQRIVIANGPTSREMGKRWVTDGLAVF